MELHKLPAGRLATVFYKAEPKDFVAEKSSPSLDSEKGVQIEDVPPITVTSHVTGHSARQLWDHNGQTLAWKNITLDLNTGGEEKRLLDNLNGTR
jgi:ATP-binding cassette, subfamily G (WHITE), member 2, SNQ2